LFRSFSLSLVLCSQLDQASNSEGATDAATPPGF
jgi:hypothetical protein